MFNRYLSAIALLAVLPTLVIGGVLWMTFAYVAHVHHITDGYPVGFFALAMGLTFVVGLFSAVADVCEQPAHVRQARMADRKFTKAAPRMESRTFHCTEAEMLMARRNAIKHGGRMTMSCPVRQGVEGYVVTVTLPVSAWAKYL